ncbi:MAG: winged helix-turn-helix domain-containing protein [Acidobacteria bacterium]|nr:winged helix-turn-helix domain-containing protein [Acidobacteriota bacterium]
MSKQENCLYEFGPFVLDPAERRLLREGRPVPLAPKAFDLLTVLVRHGGHLLGKEELLKLVWPDQFVEEGNLSMNVSTLRKALGDDQAAHRYIETVPKKGYRFAADVEELGGGPAGQTQAVRDVTAVEEEPGPAVKAIDTLAILPFVNVSADPDFEYLSDGITESIINNLSQLPKFRVMARSTVFRYKGREVDALEVGRELRVGAVLVGRVLQVGGRMIVRAELVDAGDGSQLWGAQYNRQLDDIFAVQEEIAQEISEKSRLRLTRGEKERLGKRHTENVEAYHAYLKGRYFWNKRTGEGVRKAVEYFQQAIEADPTYALAYVGLADCYASLGFYLIGALPPGEVMPKAKAAALRALEVDETLAEGHASLGAIKMYYDWDWAGAESQFRRAIELNPNYALAHYWYGVYLAKLGRPDEAIIECRKGLEGDPLSLVINVTLAVIFYSARRHEEAIEQSLKALEMNPGFYPAYIPLSGAYEQQGLYGEAVAALQQARQIKDSPSYLLAILGQVYAAAGEEEAAREVLGEFEEVSKQRYIPSYLIALIHASLGANDSAFELLEKACEERSSWLTWLRVEPKFDRLRPDPRYAGLLRRVGLSP